jgi:hypothetical protein
MPLRPRRRPLPLALAVGGGLVILAGCGSSSNSPGAATSSQSAATSAGLKFSQCMRSHGVTSFPDPNSGGGGVGFRIKIGSGVNPASPVFQAAQKACRGDLPGGGPSTGTASPAAMAHLFTISKCMRAHGITGFPDPTAHAPTSPTGYSLVLDINGAALALPASLDVASPAFKQAAIVCHFGGPGGGGPGGK